MKKIGFIRQTITSFVVFLLMMYILFNSNNLMTRLIIIPFLIFSLGIVLKNIFLILKKDKLARIMEMIYVFSFFVYYFGFLIWWDYINIINKNYVSVLFSLFAWVGGILILYKRIRKRYL